MVATQAANKFTGANAGRALAVMRTTALVETIAFSCATLSCKKASSMNIANNRG